MLAFALPGFLWALLLLPVVVALHVLRRARRERRVSALWLWPPDEAPARRARFSPTLLLLLQLLAVAAAALGAAGPRWESPGRDLALVIDAGAAMAATDVAPSRVDAARAGALRLLGGARRAVVVRAGLGASLAAGPTGDRAELRRALERLTAGDSRADVAGAVRLARSALPGAELHLWTAGAPPEGFAGTLHTVRGNGLNAGITAFRARAGAVFLAVETNAPGPRDATVVLEADGRDVARTRLRVPAGGRAVWTPRAPEAAEYRARIEGAPDALVLDDTAVFARASGRVLVTPPQADVLRAVTSVPGVRAAVQARPPATSAGYDAVVLVGALPRALPPGRYLLFAPASEAARPPPALPVSSWDAADPLLRFADLGGVRARVSDAPLPAVEGGVWTTLVRAGDRPLVSRVETPDVSAVMVSAHPFDTDLRASPAFPVLVYNLLNAYLAAPERPLGTMLPAGTVELDGRPAPGLERATVPGLYRVDGRPIVANLASPEQTRLPRGATGTRRVGDPRAAAAAIAVAPEGPWRTLLVALAALALGLEAALRGAFLPRLPAWRRPS